MIKKQRVLSGFVLTTLFFSGTTYASEFSLKNVVNTPNADFNAIGDALISSGCQQSANPNGDLIIWRNEDPLASYSRLTGNWVYHHT